MISAVAWTWICIRRYTVTHSVSHCDTVTDNICKMCVMFCQAGGPPHSLCESPQTPSTLKATTLAAWFLTATHSDVKLANPACVAVHASQYTDTFNVVATTLSALCPQVDDADAVTSDEQQVEGVVRRRVQVNSRARGRAAASRAGEDLAGPVATMRGRNMGQGRAVAVTLEDREPRMGLVSISTAWQMDFCIGIGIGIA